MGKSATIFAKNIPQKTNCQDINLDEIECPNSSCDSDTNSLRQLFLRFKRMYIFKVLRPQIYLDFNKSCQLYLPNYLDPKNAASYPNLAPEFKPPLSSQRELITLLTYTCGCLYLFSTSIRAVLWPPFPSLSPLSPSSVHTSLLTFLWAYAKQEARVFTLPVPLAWIQFPQAPTPLIPLPPSSLKRHLIRQVFPDPTPSVSQLFTYLILLPTTLTSWPMNYLFTCLLPLAIL